MRNFAFRLGLFLALLLLSLWNNAPMFFLRSLAQDNSVQSATLFLPVINQAAAPKTPTPQATATRTPTASPTATPTSTAPVSNPDLSHPANPNATQAARQVLAWLQRADQGCEVVAGQDIGTLDTANENYANLVEALHTSSGRYVGLLGADYMSWDGATDRHNTNQLLINHWNNGGLVELSWHAPNPWTGGDAWDQSQANLNELLQTNTAVHTQWLAQLDQIAAALAELQTAGVVVLWRPLHEMNGDWFWWGMDIHPDDPGPYQRLWRQMFDYFTHTKKLNNLLWVYSTTPEMEPSWTRPVDFYYPGADYVDVVGQDIYQEKLDKVDYTQLLSLGKPFAITEFGPSTTLGPATDGSYDYLTMLEQVRTRYPRTAYWLSWSDWQENGKLVHVSIMRNQNAVALLNHECVVSRDEIDWQVAPTPTPTPAADATIAQVTTPLLIDGAIDALWVQTARQSLPHVVIGNDTPTNPDLSAGYRALYADQTLYLLVDVVDDALRNDSGTDWWEDDGVELYLDGNLSHGTTYDGVNDYQLIFRWHDETVRLGPNSAPLPAGLRFQQVDTSTGYRLEVAIPLSAVGIDPNPGATFGLDVHVNDDDDGGTRDHKLAWHTAVDDSWFNPALFGVAALSATVQTASQSLFYGLEAEAASADHNIERFSGGIGYVDEGDWLRYDQVDFGTSVTTLLANVAVPDAEAGKQIEVRIDALDGPLLGVMTIQGTGGWDQYATQALTLEPVSGVHDLYFLFRGGSGVANIDSFRFAPVALTTPDTPISDRLFGMHMHRVLPNATWPTVPFHGWRLHDVDGLFWHQVEPAQGQWDFTTFDAIVDLAQQHQVELLYVLGQTPAWAAAQPTAPSAYGIPGTSSAPAALAEWRAYVRTIATRYKGKIHAYEVWNEANLAEFYSGDVTTLVELAREAYTILKAVDPTIVVVTPSFASDPTWLATYLAAGGGAYADVISAHYYLPATAQPEAMLPLIRQTQQIMRQYGQDHKPLWNTETGFGSVREGVTIDGDAALGYVARTYLVQWLAGVQRFYWYAWDNKNFVGLHLTEADEKTPTAAAGAYAKIQDWLLGARLHGCQVDASATWECTLTAANGRPALLVWNPAGPSRYTLPAHLNAIYTLDNRPPKQTDAEHLTVGVMPVYLGLE